MMNFSPYELHILLDVYVGARISMNPAAPMFAPTIAKFCEREYIQPCAGAGGNFEFAPTEKLNVLMHYIQSAPDPVWAMP